jgi:hypothetical protein
MSNVELVNDSAELADFCVAQMFTGDAAVALVVALVPRAGVRSGVAPRMREP